MPDSKIHRLVKWAFSILSEKDGTGSSSRVAMMILILSVAFSLVFYTVIARRLPPGPVLLGLSAIVTSAASIYTANAWKNKPTDAAPVIPAEVNPEKGGKDDDSKLDAR